DMAELLNARAPGVFVKVGSGSSVGGSRIRIRGSSSPSLSNEPLVYVDGIRVNTDAQSLAFAGNQQVPSRFNDINPDEIESIEVLKGPSASTLYGTEAANGVILITTKSGAAAAPDFVVIRITPFAASVPYSVEADGPFSTSMDSISSGLMSLKRDGTCWFPAKASDWASVLTRIPSTYTRGSFDNEGLEEPRIRIRLPPTLLPLPTFTNTPGARAFRSSAIS